MVKRFRFVARRTGLARDEFGQAWLGAACAALAAAPPDPAPHRLVLCLAVASPLIGEPPYDGVEIAWFDDLPGALGFATPDAHLVAAVRPVLAHERVLRGEDYLARRWAAPERAAVKEMSFTKRAPGFTLAEFAERWSRQAGRLGDAAIPEDCRGRAYVQNPALDLPGVEWPHDGVNEVYLDDMDQLHRRRAFFAARQPVASRTEAESFVSPATQGTVACLEHVLLA